MPAQCVWFTNANSVVKDVIVSFPFCKQNIRVRYCCFALNSFETLAEFIFVHHSNCKFLRVCICSQYD